MTGVELAEQFERSFGAARLNLKGVTEDVALRPTGEAGNSINWIVGHVLAYRNRILESLGASPVGDPRALEAYTEDGGWTPDGALALERLESELAESQEVLAATLRDLPSGATDDVPGPDLAFLHFHETYHVGQLGLARRCLGLPGVIEPPE